MECLRALKDEFQAATIDKEIVADLMAIIYLTRIWSSPDGMLGGNGILTQEQTNCLLTWIEIMEGCLMCLLNDDGEDAFCDYEDYRNGE